MAQFAFDANAVAPASSDSAAPPGWHRGHAVYSELLDTKDKSGKRLSFKFQITEGPHKGAVAWSSFNVANKSPKAVEIGLAEYSSLCHATGVLAVSDTEQLHFRPIDFLVEIETYNDQNGNPKESSKATKFKPAVGAPPVQQQAPAYGIPPAQGQLQGNYPAGTGVNPAPQSAAPKKPWEK